MNMTRALLVGLLLAGLCWQQGAWAQGVPPGSYLRTCQDVELRGDLDRGETVDITGPFEIALEHAATQLQMLFPVLDLVSG